LKKNYENAVWEENVRSPRKTYLDEIGKTLDRALGKNVTPVLDSVLWKLCDEVRLLSPLHRFLTYKRSEQEGMTSYLDFIS
jgi:hypothetical protein